MLEAHVACPSWSSLAAKPAALSPVGFAWKSLNHRHGDQSSWRFMSLFGVYFQVTLHDIPDLATCRIRGDFVAHAPRIRTCLSVVSDGHSLAIDEPCYVNDCSKSIRGVLAAEGTIKGVATF